MRHWFLSTLPILLLQPITAQDTAWAQHYAVDLVNPFIGTGGHGHTFPGACVPNGLVQLSPDTRPDGYNDWDGCGGYHYSDSLIYGFSHTHLSGTGIADLCDVLLMPMTGTYAFKPEEYRSPFKHVNEETHAGYYHVRLDDPQIDVELTATPHVGVHRYHFRPGQAAYVVLDLMHRDKLVTGSIVPRTPSEFVGERRSSSWAGDQRLFYCIRFSRPVEDYVMSDKATDRSGGRFDRPDTSYRAAFYFGDSLTEPLIVKVGISAVSIEGARRNVDAEVPAWDFDGVRRQAEEEWNAKLGKIKVKGGTREEKRIFYTALYHCYIAPYIFNDVDGQYRGMDGQVHHADHNVYTVFSLWDTFRALHPLMTILEPEMTSDFIKTFLLHYQQGGKLPVWELWGNETNCMIGYHSVSVIADAYVQGIREFDADLALEAMVAGAMTDDPCLNAYRTHGFISSEDCSESVSKTLEYAYDDWCIARMADAMRKVPGWDVDRADRLDSIAAVFYKRSRNWQNLFDPGTKFFRSRRNGGFIEPFDPYEVNFHYTEANAWQYSMFAPHDVEYLMHLSGGLDAFTARLDSLFTTSSHTSGRDQADITGLIGQYAHGNEPSHHMAALYEAIPARGSAEVRTHQILTTQYRDAPDGLAGNEDCGQMSAWYAMNAMGLYQLAPGDPTYSLTAPLFDKVAITVGNGDFVINAPHDEPGSFHLGSVKAADGTPTDSPEDLLHSDLIPGGKIDLVVTHDPEHWPIPTPGRYERDLAKTQDRAIPAPIISAPAAAFVDKQIITLHSVDPKLEIHYCLGPPGFEHCQSQRYEAPFIIDDASELRAWCVAPSGAGPLVTARFTKIDGSRTVKLESTYANQYAAGGDQALVDGLRGGSDFRTGEWQGYREHDMVATVDLGSVKRLKRTGLSVLQDQNAWIWYPSAVTFSWSDDGRTWSSATVENTVDRKADGSMVAELWTARLGKKARYIKVSAKNAGPCPDWHKGNGGTTWIFADEILIETE